VALLAAAIAVGSVAPAGVGAGDVLVLGNLKAL
jgi:hypothetical protein